MILGSGIIRKLRKLYILTTPCDTGPETFNAKMPKMKKKETVKLKLTHWPQIVLEKLRNLTGSKETLETHNRSINRSIDRSINQFFKQCIISGTHVKTWDESYLSYLNIGICCVEMLLSSSQGLTFLDVP